MVAVTLVTDPIEANDDEVFVQSKKFKTVQSTIIQNFQSGHPFTKFSAGGTLVDDTSDFVIGNQSIKISTATDNGTVIVQKTALTAINLTGKFLSFVLKIDEPAHLGAGASFTIDFGDNTFTNYYRFNIVVDRTFFKDNVWQRITLSFGDSTSTGSPTRNSITAIRIRAIGDAVNGSRSVWINRISAMPEPTAGICTIDLDDSLASQYTTARNKLDEYGFKASAFVITSKVGIDDLFMTLEQLRTLQNISGWDICTHMSLRQDTLNYVDVNDNLRAAKRWMAKNGFAATSDHYSYSNGKYNNDQLFLYRKFFRTCRTIVEGSTETIPPADPMRLRILNITEGDNTTTVATRVTQAINNKEWLIMLFHGVVDTVTDSSTQISTAHFNTIIDDIATQGIAVKTMSDVLAEN